MRNPVFFKSKDKMFFMYFSKTNVSGGCLKLHSVNGFSDRPDAETASVASRRPERGDQSCDSCARRTPDSSSLEGFSKAVVEGRSLFFLHILLYIYIYTYPYDVCIVRGRVTPKRATGSPSHLFSEIMSKYRGT